MKKKIEFFSKTDGQTDGHKLLYSCSLQLKMLEKTSAEDPNGAVMSIGMQRWRRRIKIFIKLLFAVSRVKCLGMGDPFQLVPALKLNKESNAPMYMSLQ